MKNEDWEDLTHLHNVFLGMKLVWQLLSLVQGSQAQDAAHILVLLLHPAALLRRRADGVHASLQEGVHGHDFNHDADVLASVCFDHHEVSLIHSEASPGTQCKGPAVALELHLVDQLLLHVHHGRGWRRAHTGHSVGALAMQGRSLVSLV